MERPRHTSPQIDLSQPSRVPFPSMKHVQMLTEIHHSVSTPRAAPVPDARDESAREAMASSPRGCIQARATARTRRVSRPQHAVAPTDDTSLRRQDRTLAKRFASRTTATDAASLCLQCVKAPTRATTAP